MTNREADQMPAACALALNRQRAHQLAEVIRVLDPCLPSNRRPKSLGERAKSRYASTDPFAANEVRLLLNALAYALVHARASS